MSLEMRLSNSNSLQDVLLHPFFEKIASSGCHDSAQELLNQFWQPSHYFPSFLAGLISVAPNLSTQTSLSRILFQELGEGDPIRAHESYYLRTFGAVGFDMRAVLTAVPNEATTSLLRLYERGSREYVYGLGCIYATEAIDLTVVKALGEAVSSASGHRELEWVDIHSLQEDDHMESALAAVSSELSAEDADTVFSAAEEMWFAWAAFYSALPV